MLRRRSRGGRGTGREGTAPPFCFCGLDAIVGLTSPPEVAAPRLSKKKTQGLVVWQASELDFIISNCVLTNIVYDV